MFSQVFSRSIFVTLTFSFFVFHCNAASIPLVSTDDVSRSLLEQLEARFEARIRSEVQHLQSYVHELEGKIKDHELHSKENRNLRADAALPPTNCADLKLNGQTAPGYYMVNAGNAIATRYCDFDLGTDDLIGHNDIKSGGSLYFNARDGSSDKGDNTDITYKTEFASRAGVWSNGVFTAPVNGTYFFAATMNKDNDNPSTYLILRQGDNEVASSYCPTHASSQQCTVAATLMLAAGDKVRATKTGNNLNRAEFTGFLIDEVLNLSPAAPTTEAPTTEAPTTEAPTTEVPTTDAPIS